MSDTVLLGIVAAVGTVLTGGFGFAIAWLDRRGKNRTAEATEVAAQASDKAAEAAGTAAEAASEEARAQMRVAIVAEREQASADWARYCEAQQRDNEDLRKELRALARRVGLAEIRYAAEAERAARAEKVLAITIAYLRLVIEWINENLPGGQYPAPPPELHLHLDLDP